MSAFYLRIVAVLDTFDPRKGFLDALPIHNVLSVNILDRECNNLRCSDQAKRLILGHYYVWVATAMMRAEKGLYRGVRTVRERLLFKKREVKQLMGVQIRESK